MSVTERVPSYAWDWVSRQPLVWREAQSRLARSSEPTASRYQRLSGKFDVLAALRTDHPEDTVVQGVVRDVVRELVFLGHTDRPFVELRVRNAPKGMRWWWWTLTGEDLDAGSPPPQIPPARQLALTEVLRGYGDG